MAAWDVAWTGLSTQEVFNINLSARFFGVLFASRHSATKGQQVNC